MANRLLYSFLVSIFCCELAIADNYAILVSAGKATQDNTLNNSDYWFDLYLAYEYLLLEEHYDSANVFVFDGDGVDYNTSKPRYKKDLHNWGKITDFDNSYVTMSSVLQSLNNLITDSDNILFYWVVGHGNKMTDNDDDSYRVYIANNNEHIYKYYLVSLINTIEHYNKRKIIWMTCNSGAMGGGSYNVNNSRTTIITSSTTDEKSYCHYYNTIAHSDFNYALFSLSTGNYPNGSTCNLNQFLNSSFLSDSLLSINELHSGIIAFDSLDANASQFVQHPCLFDMGVISDKTFIGENKELKDVTLDSCSYWLDRMELSDVIIDDDAEVSIDVDVQCVMKKNTYVPIGTTLIIK